MKRTRLLLIDGDNLVHRCSHALSNFRDRDGKFLGGLFGSLSAVRGYLGNNLDHVPIILWDDRSRGRLATYPQYKSNREQTDFREEIKIHIKITRRVLRDFGIRSVFVPGHEADDLIAALAKRNPSTIQSTDKDFFQLLEYDGTIIDRGRQVIYDRERFVEEYDVTPSQFRISQAIAGDSSDGVIGVRGVAEIKRGKNGNAKKILKGAAEELFDLPSFPSSHPDWEILVDRLVEVGSDTAYKLIDELPNVIRNYEVVELISDRFAPPCARSCVEEQVTKGYTGRNIKRAVEQVHELDHNTFTGEDLEHMIWVLERMNNNVSGVVF